MHRPLVKSVENKRLHVVENWSLYVMKVQSVFDCVEEFEQFFGVLQNDYRLWGRKRPFSSVMILDLNNK